MAILNDTQINGNLNVTEDVQIGGNAMVDYVVEQGTSGIWTYRKWNSGIAECWGRYQPSSKVNCNTAWGSLYYGYINGINFPSNLFVSSPVINTTTDSPDVWSVTAIPSTTATQIIYFCSPVSREYSIYVSLDAKGKWK